MDLDVTQGAMKWTDFNTRGAMEREPRFISQGVRISRTILIATRIVHDEA